MDVTSARSADLELHLGCSPTGTRGPKKGSEAGAEHHSHEGSAEFSATLHKMSLRAGNILAQRYELFVLANIIQLCCFYTPCPFVEEDYATAGKGPGSAGMLESDEESEGTGTTSSYFNNKTNKGKRRKRFPPFKQAKKKKTSQGGGQQSYSKGYVVLLLFATFLK